MKLAILALIIGVVLGVAITSQPTPTNNRQMTVYEDGSYVTADGVKGCSLGGLCND